MAVHSGFPVQLLEEHILGLEAALAVCRAEPRPRPIHRLRSQSRRIEALLVLLKAQRELPPFRNAASKVLRELRKLRRPAGHIRDADAQVSLLRKLARRSMPETARVAAESLIAQLSEEREQASEHFRSLLAKREAKVATRLEDLRKALKPSETTRLAASAYLQAADAHFRRAGVSARLLKAPQAAQRGALLRFSDTELHDLRKAAKLARYLAEAAPQNQHTRAAAKRFQTVQNAGGHWHDSLELAAAARKFLGRKHGLTVTLKEMRNRQHAAFLHSLETIL